MLWFLVTLFIFGIAFTIATQDYVLEVCIDRSQFVEHFVQECHNFLAGDVVRSRSKNAKLAIRGVFGSICRHEFPALFVDMHHGER